MLKLLGKLVDRLRGASPPEKAPQPLVEGPPSASPEPSAPASGPHRLLDDFVRQGQAAVPAGRYLGKIAVQALPAGKAILDLERETQADLAIEVLLRLAGTARRGMARASDHNYRQAYKALAAALFRKKLGFDHEGILRLAKAVTTFKQYYLWQMPVGSVLGQFETYIEQNGLPEDLRAALTPVAETVRKGIRDSPDQRRLLQRIESLLAEARDESSPPAPGEAWADVLLAWLSALPAPAAVSWHRLLTHCRTATSTKPSQKWLRTSEEIVERIGAEDFRSLAARVLSRIGQPRNRPALSPDGRAAAEPTLIGDADSDLLRGLAWTAGRVADRELIAVLGQAADACFKKIEGLGPRSPKIGNACLQALSHASDPTAAAQISRLKTRARHASTRRLVDQAIGDAARRQGVTADELEERGVPDFGLQEVGILRQALGDFTAEMVVKGPGDITLGWRRADDKVQKSVPAAVRAEHAAEVKALQRTIKEIDGILAGQRDRIERLYLTSRDWDLAAWRELYLDHPLVGILARRLIWRFRQGEIESLGLWRDGEIVDAGGTVLADLDDTARVALWHPLESPAETVRAWRDRLERDQITQPFKQAHREIYILTDAELQTETYSNRFAAHILKQHQFAALCQQRGWRYTLQGRWDSQSSPYRLLPEHGLRVELWVEADYEGEASEMGVFLYISTDQVRFCDLGGTPRPLAEVPPLLFSELMRDVDLFVGVASVGNDPGWMDGGERPGGAYWQDYSFGALTASAHVRRDVLERLVPRLKIAGRCTLADRFLVVRGDIRTYKIHLGSGNILMEPNDQYLCIVPDRSPSALSAGKMVLPFEGDTVLSLILSKALLLADDTRITDSTIVRQIRR